MATPNPYPSHVLSREKAEPHLSPISPIAQEAFWKAWEWHQKLFDQDAERRLVLDDTSTQAAMLSNTFFYFARPMLEASGVRWERHGRMQHGMVGQVIDLRFKKLTNDLNGMNVDTDAQVSRYNQLPLPGMALATQATYGYTLDRFARDVTGLYFVCPRGFHNNFWVWPLFTNGDGGQGTLFSGGPLDPDGGNHDLDVQIQVGKKEVVNG